MTEYPRRHGISYDPVEDTEAYKKVIEDIEKEIDEMMKEMPMGMGRCHRYWNLKKKLLAEHGIEWKTPKECNPYIMFD